MSATPRQPIVALIDNYDSFTYNLAQYAEMLGAQVRVFRNDRIAADALPEDTTHIIISPGPATPKEAGISMPVIRHYAGKLPILGVCLGHQCIGEVFGGQVKRAQKLMHGKISSIRHDGAGVFAGMGSQPINVVRYHSLIVARENFPAELHISATLEGDPDGEVMAMRHRTLAIEGVQFHPEAYYTEQGMTMLRNFLSPPSD